MPESLDPIEELKRAVKRWKTIALGAILFLVLLVLLASGLGVLATVRVERERRLAEEQAQRAVQQAEEARQARRQAQQVLDQMQRPIQKMERR